MKLTLRLLQQFHKLFKLLRRFQPDDIKRITKFHVVLISDFHLGILHVSTACILSGTQVKSNTLKVLIFVCDALKYFSVN